GDFGAQMQLVNTAREESNQRVTLCDLNWTRLVQMRLALAQFFDQPAGVARLAEIKQVEIDFAPGYRSTGVLLTGWLASQLGWLLDASETENGLRFTDPSGQTVAVKLQEIAGDPVGRCSIFSGEMEFRVEDSVASDLLEISHHVDGEERMRELMPASRNEPVALMREELMRGGPHRVYLRAVEAVRDLF
ncbi:MAG: OpcA/G6PD domain-containing protein, partial [Chthoniobacterales bacterium]